MPSQKYSCHNKPSYSLFRLEIVFENDEGMKIYRIDSSNHELEFLDAKDHLYQVACQCKMESYMPQSFLLAWDCTRKDEIPDFPSYPALLKAPLGSGGFGLYFVYSKFDVLEVIRCHRKRAEERDGFLEELKRDYEGRVPSWTLQRYIPSLKLKEFDMCKCQIRAYIVLCDEELFLYPTFEVRLPYWDIPLDDILSEEFELFGNEDNSVGNNIQENKWSDPVECECVGAGHARPYNEGRNKSRTRRMLLEEISELVDYGAAQAVHNCMMGCFHGLKDQLSLQKMKYSGLSLPAERVNESLDDLIKSASVAVAGVDLVVSRNSNKEHELLSAHIVEVNNNPAMPSPRKHSMSVKYKQHLAQLSASICALAFRHCR